MPAWPNQMFIDGKWANSVSGQTWKVVNPATGEALADVLLPHLARPARGPGRGQRRTGVDAISLRPEKLRPIGRRQQGARQQKAGDLKSQRAHGGTISCRRLSSPGMLKAMMSRFPVTTFNAEIAEGAEKHQSSASSAASALIVGTTPTRSNRSARPAPRSRRGRPQSPARR